MDNHNLDDELGHHDLDVNNYMNEMKVPTDHVVTRMIAPRYQCPYGCNKLVASRTIDYHKNNGCGRRLTDNIPSHPELKKRYYCCGACLAEFITRVEFHAHLRIEHDVHPEVHTVSLKDRATFNRFIRWLESEGGAHFRHKSGPKRRGRGKGIFMACNRSGFVNSQQDRNCSDRTGPFRLGFSCTAYVHATEHQDGTVTAEVCGDHYGHDARMRLPNIIKYIIANKQIEGEQPMEIIGYLRKHFLALKDQNIYAQRICFVDAEELKAIYISNTKKWELKGGVPNDIEMWEEELLDQAGILREGVPRLRPPHEKSTYEIAIQEQWPRPRMFDAKVKSDDGSLVNVDFSRQDGMAISSGIVPTEYANEGDDLEDSRYMQMHIVREMDDYGDETFAQEDQMMEEEEHQEYIIKDKRIKLEDEYEDNTGLENHLINEIDVEIENETEVETTCEANGDMLNDGHQTEEIVIVDGPMNQEIEMHSGAGPSNLDEQFSVSYLQGPNAINLQQIFEEMESMRETLLKRVDDISPANMKSLLVRVQSLHNSILEKDRVGHNTSVTVFPSRGRFMYRPGKGLEKTEAQITRMHGDVSLIPIQDEMSDDENIIVGHTGLDNFNANIWS